MSKIGVIGSGTWGTALAVLLTGNGHEVELWSAVPAEVEALTATRRHPNLGDTPIPEKIRVTGDLEQAMKDKELLVLSVPSVYVRETAHRMAPFLKEGQVITNVAKGIEDTTLKNLSEIIEEELPAARVTVLSGPSHAEEVSRGLPTTCVAGAHRRQDAELVQNLFMSPVFRVYTSPDMLGIELGGALKNVIALAAGIADGLGCGDNTKAALISFTASSVPCCTAIPYTAAPPVTGPIPPILNTFAASLPPSEFASAEAELPSAFVPAAEPPQAVNETAIAAASPAHKSLFFIISSSCSTRHCPCPL